MIQPQGKQQADAIILHEINLGQHHLFLMSDQSIELMRKEETVYIANNIISLNNIETYRLLICLQELFKEDS